MGYILKAIDKEEKVRFALAITTDLVEEARKIHNTSPTASAALGRSLTATAIMASWLKNPKDTITFNIKSDGPAKNIIVTGKNDGYIKAFIANPQEDLPLNKKTGKLDVGGLVGKGLLTITIDNGLKEPYHGTVPLISGEIGEDLANYFLKSDQVPSAVGLGVLVDKDITIKASAGFIIQMMPGAGEEEIRKLEENLKALKSISHLVAQGYDAYDLLEKISQGFDVKILEKKEISYRCNCSLEKVKDALISIGPKEIKEIIEEDKKASINCYFCNKDYKLDLKDLEEIYNKAVQINTKEK